MSPEVPPTDDLSIVRASLDWSRDKLEKLCRYSTDQYTVSNLRSIAAAMDPAKNPRLKSVYERRKGGSHG
jgi:hypothetical protein